MTLETTQRAFAESDATSLSAAHPILVLGMHRGGTSALAGMLHLSGFDLGPALMQPAQGVNDRGFFEHLDAFKVHERLLASLGRSRFDPREMPTGWREHPAFRIAVDEVRDLIRRDFAHAKYWAVKDPRMCRIVPVWLEALASLDLMPRVVIIVRHPAEVARSMQAQRWIASTARAHLCWLQHMLEAEEATRAVPRSLITYDALLADWRCERDRLGRDLALEWPALAPDGAAAIDAFLDSRERHFLETTAQSHATGAHVPLLAAELVDAVTSRDENAWQRIAAIGETFRRGAAAFGPCLDEAIVEASLAFIEVGQGRIDAAARADRKAEFSADLGKLSDRIDALLETLALREQELASRDTISRDLAQRHADELHTLGESVANMAVQLEKLRAEAESRFSLRRLLGGRAK